MELDQSSPILTKRFRHSPMPRLTRTVPRRPHPPTRLRATAHRVLPMVDYPIGRLTLTQPTEAPGLETQESHTPPTPTPAPASPRTGPTGTTSPPTPTTSRKHQISNHIVT